MFDSDQAPLTSGNNGLSLREMIVEAFDDCRIAIVPVNSILSAPTERKMSSSIPRKKTARPSKTCLRLLVESCGEGAISTGDTLAKCQLTLN